MSKRAVSVVDGNGFQRNVRTPTASYYGPAFNTGPFVSMLLPELRQELFLVMDLQSLGRLASTCRLLYKELVSAGRGCRLTMPAEWKKVLVTQSRALSAAILFVIEKEIRPSGLFMRVKNVSGTVKIDQHIHDHSGNVWTGVTVRIHLPPHSQHGNYSHIEMAWLVKIWWGPPTLDLPAWTTIKRIQIYGMPSDAKFMMEEFIVEAEALVQKRREEQEKKKEEKLRRDVEVPTELIETITAVRQSIYDRKCRLSRFSVKVKEAKSERRDAAFMARLHQAWAKEWMDQLDDQEKEASLLRLYSETTEVPLPDIKINRFSED